MPEPLKLPKVMFVDDQELLVQALGRQVRGVVAAELVTSPAEAVERLAAAAAERDGAFAAVVSDMRMPGMNGAALLARAKEVSPETTRLLLTGYTDMESAVAAVNTGAVFRFLTKPCSTPVLRTALDDAIAQHELVRDRRELLERTLRGAVEALVETLAMTHPQAFARASRLRRLTSHMAEGLGLSERWPAEIAAQFAEIGVVTLPPEALEALQRGTCPTPAVARMLEGLPEIADRLLARIPHLGQVRAIVRAQQPVDQLDPKRLIGVDPAVLLVQAVREYDALTVRGKTPTDAIAVLRQRPYHTAEILAALARVVSSDANLQVVEVPVNKLRAGMTLAADLRTANGMLLVAYGHVLTDELLARVRNFAAIAGLIGTPLVSTSAVAPDGDGTS
jgi:FixJ family two-component response regulator